MQTATKAKLVLLLVAVVALGAWVLYSRDGAEAIKAYNRIVVELVDQHKDHEAAKALEELLPTAPARLAPEIRKTLAECYLRIGDDPGLPLVQSAEWYRKASAVAPEILSDTQRQVIQTARPAAAAE